MVVLQVMPGAEVGAGQYVNLFIRGVGNIPVGGSYVDTFEEGPSADVEEPLRDLTEATGTAKVGFGVQLGFQVRLTLIPDRRRHGGPLDYDDEEEDLY